MAAGIRNIRKALLYGTGCGSCFGTANPTRKGPRVKTVPPEVENSRYEAARRLLDNFEF